MSRKVAPRLPIPVLKWTVRLVEAEVADAVEMMKPLVAKGRSDPKVKGDPNYELARFALPGYAGQLEQLKRMEEWLDTTEGLGSPQVSP